MKRYPGPTVEDRLELGTKVKTANDKILTALLFFSTGSSDLLRVHVQNEGGFSVQEVFLQRLLLSCLLQVNLFCVSLETCHVSSLGGTSRHVRR